MMHLDEVAHVVGGTPDRELPSLAVTGVCTDTKKLKPGELFVALKGQNHDGHFHLADAFSAGAFGAVVEHAQEGYGPQIVVASTREALGDLAAAYRLTMRGRVVAVTGSCGKTTTKDMIAHLLGKSSKVHKAEASFNNDVGVPLTLLGAEPAHDAVVCEAGTNAPGEIARLGQIARPDVAVITTVAPVHLEGLGSIEGIAAEKASLLRYLRGGGHAVINGDCDPLKGHLFLPDEKMLTFGRNEKADLRVTDVESTPAGIRFKIGRQRFEVGLIGGWNAMNAAAATGVGVVFGLSIGECATRLADFRAPKMRMERLELGGVTIINDAYNSNPETATNAVAEFSKVKAAGRKVAVIGDMKELGRESARYHQELGAAVSEAAVDLVIAVGPECAHLVGTCRKPVAHFASVELAREYVMDHIAEGDCVLLKGSRVMGLEKVVKYIAEKMTQTRPRVAV
jgi:UDP-N-acetylmuramoyl-tripeptide--D-alanyl-D-alanine ligase